MSAACELGGCVLQEFASRFSRHDYTLPQLFACLVVREQMQLSFRKTEALLRDNDWCARLGMKKVPDHSTLCRAFTFIVVKLKLSRMLDVMAHHQRRKMGRVLAVDSTLYDTHQAQPTLRAALPASKQRRSKTG